MRLPRSRFHGGVVSVIGLGGGRRKKGAPAAQTDEDGARRWCGLCRGRRPLNSSGRPGWRSDSLNAGSLLVRNADVNVGQAGRWSVGSLPIGPLGHVGLTGIDTTRRVSARGTSSGPEQLSRLPNLCECRVVWPACGSDRSRPLCPSMNVARRSQCRLERKEKEGFCVSYGCRRSGRPQRALLPVCLRF